MSHRGRHCRVCFQSCVAEKAHSVLKNMFEWIGRRDRSALRFERVSLQVKGGQQNGRRKGNLRPCVNEAGGYLRYLGTLRFVKKVAMKRVTV